MMVSVVYLLTSRASEVAVRLSLPPGSAEPTCVAASSRLNPHRLSQIDRVSVPLISHRSSGGPKLDVWGLGGEHAPHDHRCAGKTSTLGRLCD